MNRTWHEHHTTMARLLAQLSIRDRDGRELPVDDAFRRWHDLTAAIREKAGAIYLCGNGASASMASHFSADLAKNGHLHTEVFSDLSLITAISNDISYEQVFAIPLSRRAKPGDLLVAISSSGRSPNILAAVKVARERGAAIVTLSAMKPDNPLRASGDLNIYIPAAEYGHAESCHATILHHWMDMVQVE